VPLTPKQQRFCEEYVVDLNGTQAAIRAGYAAPTANRTASKLLSKTDIQAEIQSRRQAITTKTELKAEWIIDRLRREATLSDESATHSARVAALTTLAKISGLLTDRVKVDGDVKIVTKTQLNLNGMNANDLAQFRTLVARAIPADGDDTAGTAEAD
jgi:phage terminase small subunit